MSEQRWSGESSALRTVPLSEEAVALLARRRVHVTERAAPSDAMETAGEGVSPLSSWQEGIWFIDQLEPDLALYNRPAWLRLRGRLDVSALDASLREIFRRHAVLRSRVVLERERLAQCDAEGFAFHLALVDLSDRTEREREALYAQIRDADARAGFDLGAGPFARAKLVKLAAEEHVLLFTAHHIAFDGWSAGVFHRELGDLYGAHVARRRPQLSAPERQYADFASWQRTRLDSSAAEHDASYWLRAIGGAPPLLQLPTDRKRPGTRTHSAGRVAMTLPADLVEQIRLVGRGDDATLFMTMLAAVQVLLSRLSGQRDVVVGVPVAGRTQQDTMDMIGCFINVLPMRSVLSADMTFRQLLANVRRTALDGFTHQELPFDVMVERLKPERSASYTPITQVLLNFRNTPAAALDFGGLEVTVEPSSPTTVISDLEIDMERDGDGLRCVVLYSTELFDEGTIQRWLGNFRTLLCGIASSPEQQLRSLPLLSAEERRAITKDWNATDVDFSLAGTLDCLVERAARRSPDATAVVAGRAAMSYRELNDSANQLAHELVRRGARPGVLVGVWTDRSARTIVAVLAIIKSGAGYVPLDPALPAERLRYMVADSKPAMLIIGGLAAPSIPQFDGEVVDMDDARLHVSSRANLELSVSADAIAYVIYTSGSTGKPKGVVIPRRALTNLVLSMCSWFEFRASDRLLAVAGISFDLAGADIWLPLVTGATTILASREEAVDGARLCELLELHSITFMQATPATWQLLLAAGWNGGRNMQCASSGDALPPETGVRLARNARKAWNLYGPTETTIWSTGFLLEDAPGPMLVGMPIANTRCYVLDDDCNPQPPGVAGELWIAGDGLAHGYLNAPELTREKFIADPFSREPDARMYRSGDIARYAADGNLEILGRIDNQVKIRGFRIELGEIESALESCDGIVQATAIVREDLPGEKRVVAYVVPDDGGLREDELRAHLRRVLPEYMLPSAYVPLESLPLTANGKVDRAALLRMDSPFKAATRHGVAATGYVEQQLCGIWTALLGRDDVGVTDDFFALGGHSLLAVTMMERAGALFGVRPPLAVLFATPTIQHLAAALVDRAKTETSPVVCVQQGDAGRTPLFLLHGDIAGAGLYTRRLAKYFDPGQPLFAIGPHRRGGPSTIAGMAADLVQHITDVQPDGPYLIAGYCNGGMVGLEIAQRLRASGQCVDLLAVIDASAQNVQLGALFDVTDGVMRIMGFDEERRIDTFLHVQEAALRFLRDELPSIDASSSFSARARFSAALLALLAHRASRRVWRAMTRMVGLRSTAEAASEGPPELDTPVANRMRGELPYIARAMRSYIPRAYDGTITVIGASDGTLGGSGDQSRYWRTVSKNAETVLIPGDHNTIMTDNLGDLAAVLSARLPRSQ